MAIDRVGRLRAQQAITGIDFVYVHPDQVTLDVYFLRRADGRRRGERVARGAIMRRPLAVRRGALDAYRVTLRPDQVRVYAPAPVGSGAPDVEVAVVALGWHVDDEGRGALRVRVAAPGGFEPHRLAIADDRLDPYFDDVAFSFKANCPTGIDCACPEGTCPAGDDPEVAIDYRARDFWSMRRALLDFASLRYPAWEERSVADVGVMLTEAMAALADEMAYAQDRIGREAYLETATQRRSIRRHARLVDYTVHDGLAAHAWLDVTVADGLSGAIPAGTAAWARPRHGDAAWFAVGRGLADALDGLEYEVDAVRNALEPHIWDEDDTCLRAGATELFVRGHLADDLPFDDPAPPDDPTGRRVLLQTAPASPAIEARRVLVRLVEVDDAGGTLVDPLTGDALTRLRWEAADAPDVDLDLETLTVRANLVPLTAGRTVEQEFAIGPVDAVDAPAEAIERSGPGGAVTYLVPLEREAGDPDLAWLGDDPAGADPEIHLVEIEGSGGGAVEGEAWEFRRSLVGTHASMPGDRHFTLDDGAWGEIVHARLEDGSAFAFRDYAANDGRAIRFGDGEFGRIPERGTTFRATFRLGNGTPGNVPAGAIRHLDAGGGALSFVESVTNPLPASGGLAPESDDDVRRLAPDAYRAVTYRAVRPEDYAEAVERLDWVQRAGAAFRWTGSWLAAVATADPLGAAALQDDQRGAMRDQLERFRQTGRPVLVRDPRYADLDLEIQVCATTSAFPGDVREAVQAAVVGDRAQDGFFGADAFTFGTMLYRSALEAAIQRVPGVRFVDAIRFRRRGWFDWRALPLVYAVADDEVIRVEHDAAHPDRGTVRVEVRGGA